MGKYTIVHYFNKTTLLCRSARIFAELQLLVLACTQVSVCVAIL